MTNRRLSFIAGASYLIIFFTAIYANFFVLENILDEPLRVIGDLKTHTGIGAIAFMIAAVFDVVVAWALYEIYKNNQLNKLSTWFRIMHAGIMGMAVFSLIIATDLSSREEILMQINIFNTIWLIGLFFFGVHLILLSKIIKGVKMIPILLGIAGTLYVIDTVAHFTFQNYDNYAHIFLVIVSVFAILGEMSFALWLLIKGGKSKKPI